MNTLVAIREYASLTTAAVSRPSLDEAQISQSAFDWLCELSARFKTNGAPLLYVGGKAKLKWDSYVGVIETPCGTRIEVLPKHVKESAKSVRFNQDQQASEARQLLKRLIASALNIQPRHAGPASLQLFNAPLHEWVMAQFLAECEQLVQRGLRFDYERMESEERYLRGQLNVAAQMRQRPGREHFFHIRYDELTPNRPENRLLKTALEKIERVTRNAANLQHAHRLRIQLASIPVSQNIKADFASWSDGRLLQAYKAIKPWCELVLGTESPLALTGDSRSISLLFPMERLFEAHVARQLQSQLTAGATLKAQARSQHLCTHKERGLFELQPDVIIDHGADRFILDTKWKLIGDEFNQRQYGLSQADFYQLFAYGHKYRATGSTTLVLVYPKWDGFTEAISQPFYFGEIANASELKLWVVPFDLSSDTLLAAPVPRLPLAPRKASASPPTAA